jgi:transposase
MTSACRHSRCGTGSSKRISTSRRDDGLSTDERTELARLRRENRVLREERDILKKAAAFFAKETRSTL